MTTAHDNNHDYEQLYYDSKRNGIAAYDQLGCEAPFYRSLMEATLQDPHIANILDEVDEAMRKNPDATIIPKFTCSGCGERCWGDNPDEWHYQWEHTEKNDRTICGYKTLIAECDLGFAMILQSGGDTLLMATPEGQPIGSMVQVLGEGKQADKWRAALDRLTAHIPDGNRRLNPPPKRES